MKEIIGYVEELFKNIPESEQKNAVMQEITQNLEEKVWDLMEQGKAEEDAINKAIVDFGDIEDLKQELSAKQPVKRNLPKLNLWYSIWSSLLIISLFVFINFYYTPDIIWFVYPTFVVLWWPLTMYFSWKRKK
ncbi:permease prefix domain 1-containing protein [Virgibacillus sp. Bac332]|uniref:permease prefix domain 1-containing protein n=1 Tax=Virgibacillus sp. Bac332 TaxID=2419842 RepID=UPI000EF4ED3A|nr:permease prefix domain 1-containing protein [Virgibacillus sp. Bac332]